MLISFLSSFCWSISWPTEGTHIYIIKDRNTSVLHEIFYFNPIYYNFACCLVGKRPFYLFLPVEQSDFLILSVWCFYSSLEIQGLWDLDQKYSMWNRVEMCVIDNKRKVKSVCMWEREWEKERWREVRIEREESEERERRKRYHQDTAGSLKDLRKARLYHSQFISYNSFHALTTMYHDCHLWP